MPYSFIPCWEHWLRLRPPGRTAVLLCLCPLPAAIGWWYDYSARDVSYGENVRLQAAALRWHPDPQYAFRLGLAYYNQAFKDPAHAPTLLKTAQDTITPWLLRTPVNYDLTQLQEKAIYFQSHLPTVPKPKK